IIYYLKSELMLNDQLIGIVYSISGLGSLLGAVCLSTILKDKSVMKTLTISMLLIPVFVITSAIFNNWIIFAISYACMSFMITVASVSITTLQQQQSDEQNLGKILSSAFVISMTLAPLGGIISSSVSANYSSSFSLIILGTGALALVLSIFIINFGKYKQVKK
ncbi:MFS transporter, partial [Enterococcus faecalis]|nr:MFS transporter [Enterococcus faecalis]